MKLNKELIGALVQEHTTIGQSHLKIAEYLKGLEADAPSIEEVLPTTVAKAGKTPKPKKEVIAKEEPAVEEEAVEEEDVEEEEVDLNELSLKELKALADENEVEYPKTVKKPALIKLLEEALAETDEEEEVEADEVDEDGEEEIDLEELGKDELLSFIEENELGEAPKKKKTEKVPAYEARLREFIEEALAEQEDADDEGEDEDVDSEEESDEEEVSTVIETEDGEVDLADMNVKQLKKFAKDYEIEVSAKDKDGLIEEILEAIYADDEDESEDEGDLDEDEVDVDEDEEAGDDIAEQLGLKDMEIEDLAEILSENGLSTKGKKQALIDRIVRAVENGDIEVDEEGE